MFLMTVETIYIPGKVKHIAKALVISKELGETLVRSWQKNRGKNYEIHIVGMDEANPKKHKNLGTYMNENEFVPPQDLGF